MCVCACVRQEMGLTHSSTTWHHNPLSVTSGICCMAVIAVVNERPNTKRQSLHFSLARITFLCLKGRPNAACKALVNIREAARMLTAVERADGGW